MCGSGVTERSFAPVSNEEKKKKSCLYFFTIKLAGEMATDVDKSMQKMLQSDGNKFENHNIFDKVSECLTHFEQF